MRYDMSVILLCVMIAAVSTLSLNGLSGDVSSLDCELGTATGLLGSVVLLSSGRGLISVGLEPPVELEAGEEPYTLEMGREWALDPWAWWREGSGGAATRWLCTGWG